MACPSCGETKKITPYQTPPNGNGEVETHLHCGACGYRWSEAAAKPSEGDKLLPSAPARPMKDGNS